MIKLLKAYIKNNLKIILLVIVIMSISVAGAIAIMMSEYSENINHYNYIKKYSSIYGCEGNKLSIEEVNKIKEFETVKSLYNVIQFDSFIKEGNGKKISMEGYNKKVLDLYKMNLVAGQYPKNDYDTLVFNADNKYKIGDYINGKIYYETSINGQTNSHFINMKLKVVGIVDNKVRRYSSAETFYTKINNSLIPKNDRFYKVYINFKSGNQKLENETNKLINYLQLSSDNLYANRDLSQINSLMVNLKMDNPRFKYLVFSGMLFSLVTIIIYSKKRIEDMKLLRIVGASKKQVMLLLGGEGIIIATLSEIIGTISGYLLTKILIYNVNYTLAVRELFNQLPKIIHYNIYFSQYTFKIVIIPIAIAFLYQVLKVNKGLAYNGENKLGEFLNKIVHINLFKNKNILDKVSSINFKKNVIYLLIPVILLSLPVSNYIRWKNADEKSKNSTYSTSGITTMYAHRNSKVDRNNYFIPEFGFDEKDISKIDKINSINEVLPVLSVDVIYLSDKDDFRKEYTSNKNKNVEYSYELLSFDKRELNKYKAIYNELKGSELKSDYPKVYLKDRVYSRYNNEYISVFKNKKVGEIVNFRVPLKNGNRFDFKNIKMQVAGFINTKNLGAFILSKGLIGGAYIEPNELNKVLGYKRYNTVYFNSTSSEDMTIKKLREAIGNEYQYKNFFEEFKSGDGEKQVSFEIFTNMIYTVTISVFTILSSLKIIFSMRKREDHIINCVGASKRRMKKMYMKEGIKYGIISSLITASISLYGVIEEYMYMKKIFSNTILYINYYRVLIFSLVPFMIFVVCYYIAINKKEENGRT